MTLNSAGWPCMLAVKSGSTTLYSMVEANGQAAATANLTPLTQLVMSHVAQGDPGAVFASFDGAARAKVTQKALDDAQAAVAIALKGAVETDGIDPLKNSLTLAAREKAANPAGQQLKDLAQAAQKARLTMADLAAALKANASSPAVLQTFLRPTSASCAGLRSGNYRLLDPGAASASAATGRVTIDAVALTYTEEGAAAVKPIVAAGDCRFSLGDGAVTAVVAPSGLAVLWSSASRQPTLLVPEQALPASELAGDWNFFTYGNDAASKAWKARLATATFDATGKQTRGQHCVGADCTPWWPQPGDDLLPTDKTGGFTSTAGDGSLTRAFGFKTMTGRLSLVALKFDREGKARSMLMAAKVQPLKLPTVGASERLFELGWDQDGRLSYGEARYTVKHVDAVTGTYTDIDQYGGEVSIVSNQPRAGLRSWQDKLGIFKVAPVGLPLPDTGLTVFGSWEDDGASSLYLDITLP